MGNSWAIRVISVDLFVQIHLDAVAQSYDKGVLLFLVWGGHLSPGKFYDLLLSRNGRADSTSCTCSFSVPLALFNQYDKVTYSEMACPEPLWFLRPKNEFI